MKDRLAAKDKVGLADQDKVAEAKPVVRKAERRTCSKPSAACPLRRLPTCKKAMP